MCFLGHIRHINSQQVVLRMPQIKYREVPGSRRIFLALTIKQKYISKQFLFTENILN